MGLDTSHNAWHGPYSTFNRFRYCLGHQIGISLDDYKGYGNIDGKDLSSIDHDIMPLLNHSDCDGILTTEECQRVANGLQQILDNFKDLPSDYDFKERIIQFKNGCLLAVKEKQKIDFH